MGTDSFDVQNIGATDAEISTSFAHAVDTPLGAMIAFADGSVVLLEGVTAADATTLNPIAQTETPGDVKLFDTDDDGTIDRIETYTHDANGNRTRTDFDDDADGRRDRIETYTHDASGNLTRTAFDDTGDGRIERTQTYTLDAAGNRTETRFDDDNDGGIDRVAHHNVDSVVRWDIDTDNDGGIDFSGAFPDHAGLEVVLLSLAGSGNRGTDLTIPDNFVFAGNTAPGSRVRIEGNGVDTLRFDMDDFTEGDRVDFEGENYRSFTADDGTWSFTVDADVLLFDL